MIPLEQLREDFPTPLELILLCDVDFSAGSTPHKWQARILQDFGKTWTADKPFKGTLQAANGSGKDKAILAPCALWLILTNPHAVSVITTASGKQLDGQTDKYIRMLSKAVNEFYGEELITIQFRHYKIEQQNSTMELFVTDEAGRAEGWHPIVADGVLGIFVNEAKTVPQEIFDAFHRCTGFTHRFDVSSPGPPSGYFYESTLDPAWQHYKVSAFDCPHIPESYINETINRYGKESPFVRSMIFAEFAVTDEPIVIPYSLYARATKSIVPYMPGEFNQAGLDLALAGGANSSLAVRNGNKLIAIESFRVPEATALADHIINLLRKHNLLGAGSKIRGDASGLGEPILNILKSKGVDNLVYCFNQGRPSDDNAYANFGTENWFNFKRLLETETIILPPHNHELAKQFTNRYFAYVEKTRKAILESKIKHRARGLPSPDEADAVILAFADVNPLDVERHSDKGIPHSIPDHRQAHRFIAPPLSQIISEASNNNDRFHGTRSASISTKFSEELREELAAYNASLR